MITWNVLRAAGVGAYLMLWASVFWGLVSTTSIFGRKVSKQTNIALHQAFSTSGLLLLAVHLGFLLADRFMPFTPLDLVVPMRASYRPVGVTLGIAAMFVMILGVLGTSWGRKMIGTKWWRRLHSLAVPAFTLALVHGLMTGTDTRRPAMFWMYVVSAALLLFALLVRAFTAGERPQRAKLPEGVVRRTPGSVVPLPAAVGTGIAAEVPVPAIAAVGSDDTLPSPAPPRRRPSPMAPKPIPVVFVQAPAATAPPALRTADGTYTVTDTGATTAGATVSDVPALAQGHHWATTSNGSVRPVEDGRATPRSVRGHAPTPHPGTRGPGDRGP